MYEMDAVADRNSAGGGYRILTRERFGFYYPAMALVWRFNAV